MLKLKAGDYSGSIAAILKTKNGPEGTIKILLQLVSPIGVCYVTTPPFQLSLDERGFFFNFLRGYAGVADSDGLVGWMETFRYPDGTKMVDSNGNFDERSLIGLPVYATVDVHNISPKMGSKFRTQQVTAIRSAPNSFKLDPQWLIPSSFGEPKYDIAFASELEQDEPLPYDSNDQDGFDGSDC